MIVKMKNIFLSLATVALITFASCSDDLEVRVPYPTNITLNELKLDGNFTHKIVNGGFESQGIHFNAVEIKGQLDAGFCYSNRSQRSFTWKGDETSLDSLRYSVYPGNTPNNTETYAVCHVKGDDAYFTLATPSVIQYILVANTTWDYLAIYYGDTYGSVEEPKENPNIPSKPKGVWNTYVPGGVTKMYSTDATNKHYFRLTAKGYKGGVETGTTSVDLACMRGVYPEFPKYNFVVDGWKRFDLASLGTVDKVVFYLDSSDKDASGNMRTPAWFCLDGIQLENK